MIGHRLYPHPEYFDPEDWPPTTEITVWVGWTSWLFGFDLERHPREWTLMLRLGPFGLSIQRLP